MITMNNAVVAIYKSHTETQAAVRDLQQSGFDMKKLSIVVRDYHTDEHVGGYANHIGDRLKYWGKMGALWGGAWGLLFGSAFILTPGVGSLFVAGPVTGRIVGGLGGAAVTGGLSAPGAGLYYDVDISRASFRRHKTAVNSCRFVEITLSNAEAAARSRDIINYASEEGFQEHQFSRAGQESSLAGAVIAGAGGLSAVVAGLCSMGVPRENLPRFETALKSGRFVMIAHGNREEATRNRDIIDRTDPEWLHEHLPSRANRKPNLAAA